ncbi:MAG: hypothetical protein J7500_14790 [Sphingomonas sp.]|uniref:hypothetical protein n=1 Tax=Sphingomonas sp. TaxID=28214 RepID=UPI001B0CC236|nr:hypothetical protein [Sphingomonas sp.]MBO9623974.1 hypothetical protein [Sphingomonas sp.]
MQGYGNTERLTEIIDTLIEGHALLASTIYIELINLGILKPDVAAQRLHALSDLAGSPLHRHPAVAKAMAERIRDYADGIAEAPPLALAPKSGTIFRVIDGGLVSK